MREQLGIIAVTTVTLLAGSCASQRLGGLVESSTHPAEMLRVTGLSYSRSLQLSFPSLGGRCSPSSIVVLPSGDLAVVDAETGRAGLFTGSGQFLKFLEASGNFRAACVTRGPGLSLLLLDSISATIYRFDANGDLAGAAYSAGAERSLAEVRVSKSGTAYMSDQDGDEIVVADSDWSTERRLGGFGSGKGMFVDPAGLAVDERDLLYVCDSGNARLQILDEWGGVVCVWPLRGENCVPRPKAVAVDRWGNAFVTDEGCSCLRVLDPDGRETVRLEGAGPGLAFLAEPEGLDVYFGRLFAADAWNGEIQVFEILYETYR